MKTRIIVTTLIALFLSCQENHDKIKKININTLESTTLEGTWEMIGLYNYKDNKVVDSFKTRAGNRQVKMYTKGRMMWSKLVPADSTEYFAYGTYTVNDSILKETLDYGSKTMNAAIDQRQDYIYHIVLDKHKFSQIEIDDDGNRIYSENYRRVD
jgi:hypothetical protein